MLARVEGVTKPRAEPYAVGQPPGQFSDGSNDVFGPRQKNGQFWVPTPRGPCFTEQLIEDIEKSGDPNGQLVARQAIYRIKPGLRLCPWWFKVWYGLPNVEPAIPSGCYDQAGELIAAPPDSPPELAGPHEPVWARRSKTERKGRVKNPWVKQRKIAKKPAENSTGFRHVNRA